MDLVHRDDEPKNKYGSLQDMLKDVIFFNAIWEQKSKTFLRDMKFSRSSDLQDLFLDNKNRKPLENQFGNNSSTSVFSLEKSFIFLINFDILIQSTKRT